jgi:GNAT superfamily N-acetyltransferase
MERSAGRPAPTVPQITVVPANEASWEDLKAIFGTRGDPARCQCQWFKVQRRDWRAMPRQARAAALRDQTRPGDSAAESTSGLVAYSGGEPVGWVALEPRTAYPRLAATRVPWLGRDEQKDDPGVWAATCFVTRSGFRRRGVSRALAAATVPHAQANGAHAVEGYPMLTEPGKEMTWGELFVGSRSIFADAGFREVSHPFPRRVVMRVDFE